MCWSMAKVLGWEMALCEVRAPRTKCVRVRMKMSMERLAIGMGADEHAGLAILGSCLGGWCGLHSEELNEALGG